MKFASFLHKKLVDLLNDRRIVVWYDANGDFKVFASAINAPNTTVLLTLTGYDRFRNPFISITIFQPGSFEEHQ